MVLVLPNMRACVCGTQSCVGGWFSIGVIENVTFDYYLCDMMKPGGSMAMRACAHKCCHNNSNNNSNNNKKLCQIIEL